MRWTTVAAVTTAAVGAIATHDVLQKRHAILRNFPVIGHGRFPPPVELGLSAC